MELCKTEGIYYEYYKTSDSDQELVSINKHSPIKEIGEINFFKVILKLINIFVVNNIWDLNILRLHIAWDVLFICMSWIVKKRIRNYYDFKFYNGEEDNS